MNNNPKMLIADDDEGSRIFISKIYNTTYDIIYACDSSETIQKLRSNDISIAFINMSPIFDGLKILEIMRSDVLMSGAAVIAVIESDDMETPKSVFECGADDFITKPLNRIIIESRVANVLRRASYRGTLNERNMVSEDCFENKNHMGQILNGEKSDNMETVLIVDNSKSNRTELIRMLFEEYNLLEANSANSALHILSENKNVSAILLDLNMPEMDGWKFLSECRENEEISDIPIVVLTQSNRLEDEVHALSMGASDFVRSPYESKVIIQRLTNLIKLKTALDNRIGSMIFIDNLPGGMAIVEIGASYFKMKYSSNGFKIMKNDVCEIFNKDSLKKYTIDEMLATIHPDDRLRVKMLVRRSVMTHKEIDVEYRVTAQAVSKWIRVQAHYAYSGGGAVIYFVLITDIEAQKRAENELLQANSKFRIAVMQSEMKIWEYDIKNDTAIIPQDIAKKWKLPQKIVDPAHTLVSMDFIKQDSVDEIMSALNKVKNGIPNVETVTCNHLSNGSTSYIKIAYSLLCDSDGSPSGALCVTTDITEEMITKLRYQKERSYLISLIGDSLVVMEFDLVTGQYILPEDNLSVYKGFEGMTFEEVYKILIENVIHSDDISSLCEIAPQNRDILLEDISCGKRETYVEVRMHSLTNEFEDYHWTAMTVNYIIANENNHPYAFISVRDINNRKQHELDIIASAQRDTLTTLLNRSSFEDAVRSSLLSDSTSLVRSAFVILDIDNFKQINDNYGHTTGDAVLCYVADSLRTSFRMGDIIGRLGGDEMVIFIRNIQSIEAIYKKCLLICRSLGEVQVNSFSIGVTCSMGLAVAPVHGKSFAELYIAADRALYRAKRNGKSRCELYSSEKK